jgi:hypothetical protein
MTVYPDESSLARDGLWYCDMATSPVGLSMSFDERTSELWQRYGRDHTTPTAVGDCSEEIRAALGHVRVAAHAAPRLTNESLRVRPRGSRAPLPGCAREPTGGRQPTHRWAHGAVAGRPGRPPGAVAPVAGGRARPLAGRSRWGGGRVTLQDRLPGFSQGASWKGTRAGLRWGISALSWVLRVGDTGIEPVTSSV